MAVKKVAKNVVKKVKKVVKKVKKGLHKAVTPAQRKKEQDLLRDAEIQTALDLEEGDLLDALEEGEEGALV